MDDYCVLWRMPAERKERARRACPGPQHTISLFSCWPGTTFVQGWSWQHAAHTTGQPVAYRDQEVIYFTTTREPQGIHRCSL